MDTPQPDLKRIRYKYVPRPSPTWRISLEGRPRVQVESSPTPTAESSETPDAPAGSESPSDPPATSS